MRQVAFNRLIKLHILLDPEELGRSVMLVGKEYTIVGGLLSQLSQLEVRSLLDGKLFLILFVELVEQGLLEPYSQLIKDLVVAAVVDQVVAKVQREIGII